VTDLQTFSVVTWLTVRALTIGFWPGARLRFEPRGHNLLKHTVERERQILLGLSRKGNFHRMENIQETAVIMDSGSSGIPSHGVGRMIEEGLGIGD
jgi:hypothetical protein